MRGPGVCAGFTAFSFERFGAFVKDFQIFVVGVEPGVFAAGDFAHDAEFFQMLERRSDGRCGKRQLIARRDDGDDWPGLKKTSFNFSRTN